MLLLLLNLLLLMLLLLLLLLTLLLLVRLLLHWTVATQTLSAEKQRPHRLVLSVRTKVLLLQTCYHYCWH